MTPDGLGGGGPPLKIAVVGGGVAGLGAAWLLDRGHDVTVYEKNDWIGGHTHTIEVSHPGGKTPIPVDVGFIIFNEANYPNLSAFFQRLGIRSEPSNMSFSVSVGDGAQEYGTGSLNALVGLRNLFRADHWRMLRDLVRFYREAPRLLDEVGSDGPSLGEYLAAEGYSEAFILDHLLPMGAALWSAPMATFMDFPAKSLVRFCHNHGLLRVFRRPQWRTVSNGGREYVRAALADMRADVQAAAPVVQVRRLADGGGVMVRDGRGDERQFDHVVMACHADEALALLADPSADERRVLGGFSYQKNRAYLHRDTRLMPRRPAVWSSWNYIADDRRDLERRVSVTYWMNSLQNLDPACPLFVSLNPFREPDPGLVFATLDYSHPIFDAHAIGAQREQDRVQGVRRTWFCGSYWGYGFHEDAFSSGIAVAESLGVKRPWAATPAPIATTGNPTFAAPAIAAAADGE